MTHASYSETVTAVARKAVPDWVPIYDVLSASDMEKMQEAKIGGPYGIELHGVTIWHRDSRIRLQVDLTLYTLTITIVHGVLLDSDVTTCKLDDPEAFDKLKVLITKKLNEIGQCHIDSATSAEPT